MYQLSTNEGGIVMDEEKNQNPMEIPEEALEGVSGGGPWISIHQRDIDDFVYPLFKQGMSTDQVYNKLVEAGKIKRGENYWVEDVGYDFRQYLLTIWNSINIPYDRWDEYW